MKITACPKNCFTEIIVMFQRNFTLFTDQCLGDTKGRCVEHGGQKFEQFLWLLIAIFYWWLIINTVVFPWNMSTFSFSTVFLSLNILNMKQQRSDE